ncbi:threonine dehydrogenase-like Zn-dependent dehydrogenase [Vibrio crassostreae]|uniref:zinc-binding dehydrogenase n=1 Tax=Vibrio crassostreae TaxID=246167 RepID=UPI000F4797D8|nr:zinc-binding dehydrogenase [Vibrio crassostreae]NOH74949.1 zinc-binding dehydrogenase [Vibrio crassostreae]NOI54858.1 zinc-binding dehydrogenase [Vibrio crassostreae]ROR19244.1 threonine dehydrogenase-like Zn-dependent dehydrogenase [Vibrio crassostreae]TCN76474.1 threonine dehydrogenase-like Zn-dependent dehydrogenase [Vibrio crassostreae]TCV30897.1 threonine dehydrogenase-like Zn-dependent dehydrogenase [Vibrio crassostreae]
MVQTTAAVICGEKDVQLRTFELPKISDDELLVKNISNSICLSTYKAALLGSNHKRVPDNISEVPVMTGHEYAGVIVEVGANLKDRFKPGEPFVLQPAMGLPTGYSAGYSYETFGGNATYSIIPKVAIDLDCVLPYKSPYYANASLAEPMSCIIGAFHASYHTTQYVYEHQMGIKEGGSLALLACAGPMGIGAIDYAINGPVKPSLIVVTDIDEARLARAESLIPVSKAAENGIELHYVNTAKVDDPVTYLKSLNKDKGYDDVMVYAAVAQVLEQADELLGNDGCLNFFAGPTDKQFKVPFNFYNVHYESTHIVGTSGGSTGDLIESVELSEAGKINPSFMLTHIGGLEAAPHTILNQLDLPGGKKLIYPHIDMPLTAIDEFHTLADVDPFFNELDAIVKANNYVWNEQAEKALLEFYDVNLTV